MSLCSIVLFSLLLCIAGATSPSPNYNVLCPDEFEDLNPDSNFCYKVSNVANISWGDADSTCFRYDSRLASIHDPEENSAIAQALKSIKTDAWIGLQQDVQGQWKWCDDTKLEYNNWNNTNTNSTPLSSGSLILNCTKIDNISGKWIEAPCEKSLNGIICKIDKDKCDYRGTNEQVAVDPGINVATSNTESLKECEKLCDVTRGCNSLLYTGPLSNDTVNCLLKDKTITNSDQMIEKKNWTTYYRQCESSTTNANDISTTTPIPDPEINTKDRLCPTGYFYSGDDTPASPNALKEYWPIDESPKYSCYKVIPDVSGINDGLQKCYTSTIADKMEARVVIFEDSKEVERVFKYIFKNHLVDNMNNASLLTSAMYFEDVKEWLYLGTNNSVQGSFDFFNRNDSNKQCLVIEGMMISNDQSDSEFDFAWNPVECNKPQQTVLCEIRVETVTYAWIPDWMAVVLIILTITSLFALCVGAMCITSSQTSRQTPSKSNSYPKNDLPPKYTDVIVTNESTFNRYKSKGKELLAKIYIVKE